MTLVYVIGGWAVSMAVLYGVIRLAVTHAIQDAKVFEKR
jgi:hypothetical protein